ncbi:arabinogalactan endo-1,4-beta-galactosidase [bacterium A37T11]|nr:arabinogalactan endo-1,4-beta-galactosidase [bacterium A37T11]
MKKRMFYILWIVAMFSGCTKNISAPEFPDTPLPEGFAKGADVSWVTEMEQNGLSFKNDLGATADLFQILKDKGMNAIRLRVWVNPVNGWCNTDDLLVKARRAKALGYRIMVDFHYSDTWADPGAQAKPDAWSGLSFDKLAAMVGSYTELVLNRLKQEGIHPEWVQVGNETNDGMLWEDGRASTNMANFSALINAGYKAVKNVDSSIKVIVHLANGFDNDLFRWMFDGLKANGAQWDVIGMSLYPSVDNWQTLVEQCEDNMSDMVQRYGKEVMLCEVGMPASSPAASTAFLKAIISKNAALPDGKGVGVFYWEPEAYGNWNGYTLGAFDDEGKPTSALDAFSMTGY